MTISEYQKKSAKGDILCSNFVRKEKSRYERKGYGLLVAAAIALSFFLGIPELGKLGWPYLLEWQASKELSDTYIMVMILTFLHNAIHLGGNLVYWVFYHFEIPFIERYKSND